MIVNQVVSDIDRSSGGTAVYIQGMSKELSKHNIDIGITTLKTNTPLKLNASITLNYYNRNKTQNFENKSIYDVVHINGMWNYFLHKMSVLAQRNKTPYIISPHGMLEDWSLKQKKYKKKLALKLYQKRDMLKANCIHVTATSEMKSVRRLGINNPVAIIPNGIDISDFPKEEYKGKTDKKTFLFLSRIHPKKGIELLINAWSLLNHSEKKKWRIKIIGNGEKIYVESIRKMILEKGLSDDIMILPPIFDKDKKIDVFRKADVFVLPTFSENFGIVVAEALASYTPVITTKGTPWKDLIDENCGWWIDVGVDSLKNTLIDVLNINGKELKKMGNNGRQLIEDRYSINLVAENTLKMYKWVKGEIEKPDFIHTQ